MYRAYNIPSENILKKQEIARVKQALILNGYKSAFVDTDYTRKNTASKDTDTVYNKPRGFTCLPYVKGISEKVKYILNRSGIRTAFKPVRTLENVFRGPKDRPDETRIKAIVYKFKCNSCNFTYVGETKRCWCSRWLEHKPEVQKQITSAIKDHAERKCHDVAKTDVKILEKGVKNYEKRLFLEAWHSLLDKDSLNKHKDFPNCYLPLLKDNRSGSA